MIFWLGEKLRHWAEKKAKQEAFAAACRKSPKAGDPILAEDGTVIGEWVNVHWPKGD